MRLGASLLTALLVATAPAFAALEDIENYHPIDARLATGGHVMAAQIGDLAEAGVELVINLAPVRGDHNASDGPRIAAEGISYVHIPVDWSSPSLADLELFFAVMDARGDRNTLVHCMVNYRASAFVYLYRTLRQGESDATATVDLEVMWDEAAWRKYPQWRAFVAAAKERAGTTKP